MGLWNCLIGAEAVGKKDSSLLLPELVARYQEEARLTRQIREHAEHSPHPAGRQSLAAVAVAQDRIVQRLHERLTALGAEAQPNAGPLKSGKNHWARAFQDLEDSQALERQYLDDVLAWDQDSSEIAEFFRTVERAKGHINALLRDITLRADPHALD